MLIKSGVSDELLKDTFEQERESGSDIGCSNFRIKNDPNEYVIVSMTNQKRDRDRPPNSKAPIRSEEESGNAVQSYVDKKAALLFKSLKIDQKWRYCNKILLPLLNYGRFNGLS